MQTFMRVKNACLVQKRYNKYSNQQANSKSFVSINFNNDTLQPFPNQSNKFSNEINELESILYVTQNQLLYNIKGKYLAM